MKPIPLPPSLDTADTRQRDEDEARAIGQQAGQELRAILDTRSRVLALRRRYYAAIEDLRQRMKAARGHD